MEKVASPSVPKKSVYEEVAIKLKSMLLNREIKLNGGTYRIDEVHVYRDKGYVTGFDIYVIYAEPGTYTMKNMVDRDSSSTIKIMMEKSGIVVALGVRDDGKNELVIVYKD